MFLVIATKGNTQNGILTFEGKGQVSRTAWRVAKIMAHLNPAHVCIERQVDVGSHFETAHAYEEFLEKRFVTPQYARPPRTSGEDDRPCNALSLDELEPRLRDAGVPVIVVIDHANTRDMLSRFVTLTETTLANFNEGDAAIVNENGQLAIIPSSPFVWDPLYLDPFSKTIPMNDG